jgi:hypothetical protein
VGGLGIAPEAQEDRRTQRLFFGLIWESVLRDDLILRSQLGYTYIPEHIYPATCRSNPDGCDQIPSYQQTFPRAQRWGNSNNHTLTDVKGLQFINGVEYFFENKLLGEHNLQVKDRFYTEKDMRKQSRPGDEMFELNGFEPLARTTYYSNDPRYEPERKGWFIATSTLAKNVVTLSDRWRPTRHLTFTPSISHIWGKANNSAGSEVINAQTWSPGLAVIWDATHDGRTAVRASSSSYVDLDVGSVARHTLGSQAAQRCLWNPATSQYDKDCVWSGGRTGNTIGLPCGPNGFDEQGRSCQQSLDVPRTLEVTFGGEREVVSGIGMSLDFVHRQFSRQYEVNETNRIWNNAGSRLNVFGGYRNGRAETTSDLSTPEGAKRRYEGITAGINKREGRLKANLSYTWSELVGNVFNGSNNAWGDIPARDVFMWGYLPDDHRHEIKLSLSYQATPWLSFGSRSTYLSGMPTDRLLRNDETAVYDQRRSRVGTTYGSDINDPADDRDLRLPEQVEINVQGRLNLEPLIGQRLDLYVDVLNALALRTATAVGTNDGSDYGVERTWMDPFRIRLGLNYKF